MYKKNLALVVVVVNVTFYRRGVYKKTEQNATRLIPYINQKMMYVVTKINPYPTILLYLL